MPKILPPSCCQLETSFYLRACFWVSQIHPFFLACEKWGSKRTRALVNCCDQTLSCVILCYILCKLMGFYGLWMLWMLCLFYKFLIFKSSRLRFGCKTSTSTLHLRRIWGSFFPPPGIEGVGVKLPVFQEMLGAQTPETTGSIQKMSRKWWEMKKNKISDHNLGETHLIKCNSDEMWRVEDEMLAGCKNSHEAWQACEPWPWDSDWRLGGRFRGFGKIPQKHVKQASSISNCSKKFSYFFKLWGHCICSFVLEGHYQSYHGGHDHACCHSDGHGQHGHHDGHSHCIRGGHGHDEVHGSLAQMRMG